MGGGLIRHQRKSKNKGPKRLGKHNLSKEKHGKSTSNNDDTEGMKNSHNSSRKCIFLFLELDFRSSLIIPINTKSVRIFLSLEFSFVQLS
jgi:hypothetical protein